MTILDLIKDIEMSKLMDKEKALSILKAKLICMQLDSRASVGQGCNRDCDNCDYCYAQGTAREFEQALSLAVSLLEKTANTDETALRKFYEDGRNDVWTFVTKINSMDTDELKVIFDLGKDVSDANHVIYNYFTPQEALAKLEAYENKKSQLKVGEVVKQTFTDKEYLIIAESGNEDFPFDVIDLDTFAVDSIANEPKAFTKTGKTLDIKTILRGLRQ